MKKIYFLLFGVALYGCTGSTEHVSDEDIDSLTIAKHIEVLASDEFEGRKPFTSGEQKTLEYLESEFKKYGLKPGNGDSYLQEVPMVALDATPSQILKITKGNQSIDLKLGDDFVAFTERVTPEVSLDDSDMIFAGFGIVAPEYGWNDYEGLDVKGKTVIVLVNDPGFGSGDSTFFKGETMTYYGRWTYKYEEAMRQGASGVFIVHQDIPAGYPWAVVKNGWSGASLYLDQANGHFKPAIQGWLRRDAAIKIFKLSGKDMKGFVEKSRSADFEPINLGVKASVSLKNKIKRDASYNVVAKIEGSTRPDEVIIYSSHWDHLDIGPKIDGDSIYNGAHDNASGTAALLTIAEAMKKGPQPARSVVFLAVTAEEQGLLGSKFYCENPIYATAKTVANINMDGLYYMGPMKDLTIVGYGQSELDDLAEALAKKQDRYVLADPEPEKGFFFRSDHFQFAKVGIPALFSYGSYEAVNGGVEYAKKTLEAYNETAYHQPADEFKMGATDWKLGGMVQDVSLFYQLGEQLANSNLWPKWKDGSEFKEIRQKDLKK